MPTYDKEIYGKYSPGRILLTELINWSISNNYEIFDFTTGVENYKKDWTNSEILLSEIVIVNNLKGYVIFFTNKLLEYLKKIYKSSNFLKKILPSRNSIFKILN